MQLYVAGHWVERERARVPFADPGFQYGLGVFTTLAVVDGVPLFLNAHIARLRRDARALGFAVTAAKTIRSVVWRGLIRNKVCSGVVKIIATPGATSRGTGRNGLFVSFEPPRRSLDHVRLLLVDWKPSPWRAVKSLCYLDSVGLLKRAREAGCTDAIACDRHSLLETAICNIFVVKPDGSIATPPADGRILPGVARARLLADRTLAICEQRITPVSLRRMRAVFLTNCVRGIVPVQEIVEAAGSPVWADRGSGAGSVARVRSRWGRALAAEIHRAARSGERY